STTLKVLVPTPIIASDCAFGNPIKKNYELCTRYFLRITEALIPSIIFCKDHKKFDLPAIENP
ncbi:MAG: hypothetical protein U9Q05_03160, partial [Thermodesulfobacteriota bacterium]|nr:hypothetical protein [Thermodesulfobacteriota bacterium]